MMPGCDGMCLEWERMSEVEDDSGFGWQCLKEVRSTGEEQIEVTEEEERVEFGPVGWDMTGGCPRADVEGAANRCLRVRGRRW